MAVRIGVEPRSFSENPAFAAASASGGRVRRKWGPVVTLELSKLTAQVQEMGQEAAARQQRQRDLVTLARQWLSMYTDSAGDLRTVAAQARAAVPTDERFDAAFPLPETPSRFTVIAADGSSIHPSRHEVALYYLINIGSLVYRHGSGEPPQPASEPTLGYTESDLYEDGLLVAGNLLDVRRDLAEITRLADLCVAEPPENGPTVALVDGTLLLWVLEERADVRRRAKISAYLGQLERIQASGAAVAAFISRPRHAEVVRLLHLASVGGEVERATREPNPLEHLPDRALFGRLPPGARSALFISPAQINQEHYRPAGHAVYFFYLNLAGAGRPPVIARVEVPQWVARNTARLNFVHGAIVAQARITGDYPYALARADELAFIGGPERQALQEMIGTALLRAGVTVAPSPKAFYKSLTRSGGRRRR
ncbi:MAG TPA: DNA double-strand break repair nuclease NurA [Anaerolineae bacterium]|nr:DNA double-strand break repair nuclease NurA [Anaerolineae bacterium]